jgi:hypothetical protein
MQSSEGNSTGVTLLVAVARWITAKPNNQSKKRNSGLNQISSPNLHAGLQIPAAKEMTADHVILHDS